MKRRANKLLALFLCAAMTATPYASAVPVFAEDAEVVDFSDGWEAADPQDDSQFIADEEAVEDAYAEETEDAVDVFSDGEEFGFSSDMEETQDLTTMDVAPADMVVGKAYSVKVSVKNSQGTESGMYAMDSVVVTLQSDGTYLVRMHQSRTNRNYLALTDNVAAATAHTVPWYKGNGDDGYWLTVPVASINEKLPFCMSYDDNVAAGKAFSNIQTLTFDLSTLEESSEAPASKDDINEITAVELADYSKVDEAIASIPADLSVYTDETAAAVTAAKNAIVRGYGKDKQAEVDKMAENLVAAVKALVLKDTTVETTELAVTNDTKMFKVTNAVLKTTANGPVLQVTLGSTGYEYVFKGTYEEAVANGNNRDNWIKYEDVDGAYQFTIPITAGETKIPLISISKSRVANFDKGTGTLEFAFLARQFVIDYEAKTLTTGDWENTVPLVVTNNASMFNVASASLHTIGSPAANNYSETLELTMGSNKLDKVYVGNAETADAADVANNALTIGADNKVNIEVSKNATGGASVFDYLEKPVTFSFHSVSKDSWTSIKVFTISKKNSALTIVNSVPAKDVKLDVAEKELVEGQSFDLTATVDPENTSDMIVWTSSDENVATVKDGKVTAVGEGTAEIKVTVGSVSATCNVTVVKKDFKYVVQVLVTSGKTWSKNATDAVGIATDTEGNEIKATVNASNMLEFDGLDATKTYTVKVSREGYYTVYAQKIEGVNGQYDFIPTGEWDYTATISRANANNQVNAIFQQDALKAVLKKVPADYSIYTADSVKVVQDTLNSIDLDSKDWTQRDKDAETLTKALSGLKIGIDGVYAADATISSTFAMLNLRLIVENGEMKARFIGSSTTYSKVYLGNATDGKNAADTDPNLFLPDNDGQVYTNSRGYQGYQFTIPVSALAKAITFSVPGRKATSKWTEQTFAINSGDLKPYVEATEITLNKTEYELKEKQSVTLKETVGPEDASYKNVFWKSSNDKIAKVVDGKVTGVKAGTATITVSDGNLTAECKVTVTHVSAVIPAVEPTCTETGLTEGEKCSVCGEILKSQEEVPALGHTEEVVPGKAATCTKAGLTDGLKCSVCQETLKEQEVIPALGHKEEVIPGKAATCTTIGWSEGKRCSVCGLILKSRKLVKATGHKEEVIPAVAATQGHTGLTEGKKCSVCGEILVAQKETPALPILVTKVSLSAKTSAKIAAGKKVQLVASVAPSNAANKAVTWKSSNKKVATVNANGLVTMKKNAGGKTVVITATAKDGSKVYGKIKITCVKGTVKKITISGKNTVKAGKSLTLKAKVTASAKANKKVAWSSSNKKLATVSSKGVVKTFKGKKGTVKITARALDGSGKKATFKIKIK